MAVQFITAAALAPHRIALVNNNQDGSADLKDCSLASQHDSNRTWDKVCRQSCRPPDEGRACFGSV